jgi:hypothetical protein
MKRVVCASKAEEQSADEGVSRVSIEEREERSNHVITVQQACGHYTVPQSFTSGRRRLARDHRNVSKGAAPCWRREVHQRTTIVHQESPGTHMDNDQDLPSGCLRLAACSPYGSSNMFDLSPPERE